MVFDKELWIVKPEVLGGALGVTAANAVMGRALSPSRSVRGRALVSSYGAAHFRDRASVRPFCRTPDRAVRQAEMRRFVADLRRSQARASRAAKD